MDVSNLIKNGACDLNEYKRIMGYAKAFSVINAYKRLQTNLQSTSNYHVAMDHINDYQKTIRGLQ